MKNTTIFLRQTSKLILCLAIALFANSCEEAFEFELPEANSIADLIPPAASFSYASTQEDFKTVKFTNLSTEATNFQWDFGGGDTSTEKDPTYTFENGEGTYQVSLTATDARGASNVVTLDVIVVEGPFQPIILEPGFEDNTLPDGTGDGRDSWRTSSPSWTTIFGISGSPVTYGSQAAKLEVSSARAGYQEITVEPNSNYDLRFWYTMKNDAADPWAIVSIIGVTENGPITSQQEAFDATIASILVNDTEDPSTYVQQKLSFNSGNNTTVAIYFYNDANVEARFDDFTIDIGLPGAVPPSPAFTPAQSTENFLEYTFDNSSTNAESYIWDFGDGNTSVEESPTHVYATPDVYTVTLEATSPDGETATVSRDIDIQAPVTADFTFEVDPQDYQTYSFTDASVDAEMLLWEFGDGYQFTGMNPSHTYEEDGIYLVTLTAYSVTGLMDVATAELTVSQGFIAAINDPGIENGTDAHRNRTLEENADTFFGFDGTWVVQTSSTFRSGSRSAKLPTFESQGNTNESNRRWYYQAITVEANTDYEISFYKRDKDSGAGTTVTTQIYDAPFDDPAVIDDPSRILATQILDAASGHDTNDWVEAKIQFNSGSSTEVVLFIYNDYTLNVTGGDDESESYMDDFSIIKL
ncbi:PKD domain-containing protein [Neolewinella aurantiaca]|uniref:PKD domain-containing protein n=1 Tax=Neolewinella aurantiaca TaxID=2602767 RepID=A0A5C7FM60_9BACT|nr:PKD domain-containing protein [Neolewinella aurantiaca]TXF91168.1 PKD domain-containing protein [Neolewinella aurantiaca]